MDYILIILSAVAFYAVILATKKIIEGRKHITEEEFQAYMRGGRTMSDDERSRVTRHLGICLECQGHVDEWIKREDVGDSSVRD